MVGKDNKGKIKLPRNYHAINAKMRQAGAMKHRNTPRAGTSNEMVDILEQAHDEYGEDFVEVLSGTTSGSA